jgi:hypothetical protein
MATSLFNQARSNYNAHAAWLVDMVLPELEDGTLSQSHYLGTIPLTIDGQDYKDKLVTVPTVSFSSGQAADSASFEVDNSTGYYGALLNDYDNLFREIYITIRECYELRLYGNSSGLYEDEMVFIGYANNVDTTRPNNRISFECISDVARNRILVASRILTQRTCVHAFNKNGVKDPATDPCGWQTSMPGDPLSCDFTRDGLNGCISHGNEHRMGAIVGLVNANLVTVSSDTYGIGAGGFNYNSGGGSGFDDYPDVYRYSSRGYNSY